MPHKSLPSSPSLRRLRDQAQSLMNGHRQGDPAALGWAEHAGFAEIIDLLAG